MKTVSELTSPEARERQLEAERAAAKASVLAAVVSTNIGRDCDAAQLSAVEESVRRMEVRLLPETASHTTPFAWCTPFLKDFSRRLSSPALPFQRTFDR